MDFDETDLDGQFPGRADRKPGVPQLKFDIRHVFVDPVVGQMADLRDLAAAERFDAVVAESTSIAGACLAEELGLPLVVFGIIPLANRSRDTAPMGLGLPPMPGVRGQVRNAVLHTLLEKVVFASEQRRFQAVRRTLGLPASPSFFFDAGIEQAALFLHGTIESFEYPRRDLPSSVRFVGALVPPAPRATALPDWWDDLDTDRPVVLVTQGTVKVDPAGLLHPAVEALAGTDALIVATTGGADPSAVLEAHAGVTNLRVERFIPFPDLMPHVDLVVTNGGYGGTQQALMHGVPAVVAGLTEGKNEVAARVAWAGAGIDLRTDRPTAQRLRDAVTTVLADGRYRARAKELAAEYARHDAARECAEHLEALVGARALATA